MAKKKSTASETSTEGASAPAKKSPAAKGPAKSAAKAKVVFGAPPPLPPMVDTQLAAQAAARMVTARATGMGPTQRSGEQKETSTFKQLKESFSKPHGAGVGNILNSTTSEAARKGNLPHHGGKQKGHNQTFGSDASKNFVPRRTGG